MLNLSPLPSSFVHPNRDKEKASVKFKQKRKEETSDIFFYFSTLIPSSHTHCCRTSLWYLKHSRQNEKDTEKNVKFFIFFYYFFFLFFSFSAKDKTSSGRTSKNASTTTWKMFYFFFLSRFFFFFSSASPREKWMSKREREMKSERENCKTKKCLKNEKSSQW